jgi:GNAT superfamily N-acetyltransferase
MTTSTGTTHGATTGLDQRAQSDWTVAQYGLTDLTPDLVVQIKHVLDQALWETQMGEGFQADLNAQPSGFRLFVAQGGHGGVVGVRMMRDLYEGELAVGDLRTVLGDWFGVVPQWRGRGVGAALLDAGKDWAFREADKEAMRGASSVIGSMALYARLGAHFKIDSIPKVFPKNSPRDALRLFLTLMSTGSIRDLRLGSGDLVQYAYPAPGASQMLLSAGWWPVEGLRSLVLGQE